MEIGTLTTGAGVTSTFTMQYVPAFLVYTAATQLTSLKVNVAGDGVLCDLDGTGLTAVQSIRKKGVITNTYMIPLSDGFIPNKTVDITAVNSAAQTPILYGFSQKNGIAYIVNQRLTILANSGVTLKKFAYLSLDTIAATDSITIGYVTGLVQKFAALEVQAANSLQTNVTAPYAIDNLSSMIDYVNIIPVANRTAYLTKYVAIGTIY
jgi:hypothetical protein